MAHTWRDSTGARGHDHMTVQRGAMQVGRRFRVKIRRPARDGEDA
jgi:hypothetical protein